MNEVLEAETSRSLPDEVTKKHKAWYRLWNWSAKLHYALGGLSVLASAMAATGGEKAPYLSALAALLTALIGFIHPERRYLKFVRAWRILDIAALRYKLRLIEVKELVEAVERGEKIISDFEDNLDNKVSSAQQ
jgi:hypothetical protein